MKTNQMTKPKNEKPIRPDARDGKHESKQPTKTDMPMFIFITDSRKFPDGI